MQVDDIELLLSQHLFDARAQPYGKGHTSNRTAAWNGNGTTHRNEVHILNGVRRGTWGYDTNSVTFLPKLRRKPNYVIGNPAMKGVVIWRYESYLYRAVHIIPS